MTRQDSVYSDAVLEWQETIHAQMPHLSRPQALGLALWSWGLLLCRTCSLSAISELHSVASCQPRHNWRQRLREWFYPAQQKRGKKRQELDVESCFAPLLRWILQKWRGKRLALALDATPLSDRFTVLCISVLYRGCALPVAWRVLPGPMRGSWNGHWLRLLRRLRPAVPPDYQVLVCTDRGLYSPRLFKRIVRLKWHPFLRINGGATFQRAGCRRYQPLGEIVKQMEGWGTVSGVAFQGKARLKCTLGGYWTRGCESPWLVLTDLPPTKCQASWYALRTWIERGFKFIKREGWQWHRSRIQDPERANRLWLVMAVATLRCVAQGSWEEDQENQKLKGQRVGQRVPQQAEQKQEYPSQEYPSHWTSPVTPDSYLSMCSSNSTGLR